MTIPLPKTWPQTIRSSILQTLSLAHWIITHTRSWCANSPIARVRLTAKLEQAESEIALLREELRIKDARFSEIPTHQRPRFTPTERMTILELRTVRGWSLAKTARVFSVDPDTISSWMARINELGNNGLVRINVSINKFPDHVAYTVHRLKALTPSLGKKRLAQTLSRAGLHLSATTVGRILKSPPKQPKPTPEPVTVSHSERTVTARYLNHVWHTDLTIVPTSTERWTIWFPFSLPQVWPFCWHVTCVVDQFSRKALGTAVFTKEPTAKQITRFLARIIHRTRSSESFR